MAGCYSALICILRKWKGQVPRVRRSLISYASQKRSVAVAAPSWSACQGSTIHADPEGSCQSSCPNSNDKNILPEVAETLARLLVDDDSNGWPLNSGRRLQTSIGLLASVAVCTSRLVRQFTRREICRRLARANYGKFS